MFIPASLVRLFWILALMYIICSLLPSSWEFWNAYTSYLSLSSIASNYFCWFDSIYAPRCSRAWYTVHNNGAVMFAFLVIIFMIYILFLVPVFGFTTIFHTLALHPWIEISSENGIAPICIFLHPFYASFVHIYFSALSYFALRIMCSSSTSPLRVS